MVYIFKFVVSTWVQFIRDCFVDDHTFIPANTIGVVSSRSSEFSPNGGHRLVYTINIPSGDHGWSTVKQVPEEFLAKFDRRLGTVDEMKIPDIRSYNIWNSNKTSKEMTDMDERMRQLLNHIEFYESTIKVPSKYIMPKPKKIVFNNPATVVFWDDGTKTVVKRQKGTPFNKYYGYLAALGKKLHGSTIKVERMIEQIGIEEKPAKKPRKKCNAPNEKDGV